MSKNDLTKEELEFYIKYSESCRPEEPADDNPFKFVLDHVRTCTYYWDAGPAADRTMRMYEGVCKIVNNKEDVISDIEYIIHLSEGLLRGNDDLLTGLKAGLITLMDKIKKSQQRYKPLLETISEIKDPVIRYAGTLPGILDKRPGIKIVT